MFHGSISWAIDMLNQLPTCNSLETLSLDVTVDGNLDEDGSISASVISHPDWPTLDGVLTEKKFSGLRCLYVTMGYSGTVGPIQGDAAAALEGLFPKLQSAGKISARDIPGT